MDKSRQGNPEPSQGLIIESPGLLGTRRRLTEVGVTLAFWFALLYLWQPLVSLLAWFFQGGLIYQTVALPSQHDDLLQLLKVYFSTLSVLLVLYFSWAKVNEWRFRGREQRTPRPPIDSCTIGKHYGVDPGNLEKWRRFNQMVVELDDSGHIATVRQGSLASYLEEGKLKSAPKSNAAPAQ